MDTPDGQDGNPIEPNQDPHAHGRLTELMRTHDWFYEYTETQSVWLRGAGERQELIAEFARLPKHEREYFLAAVPQDVRKEFETQLHVRIYGPEPRTLRSGLAPTAEHEALPFFKCSVCGRLALSTLCPNCTEKT